MSDSQLLGFDILAIKGTLDENVELERAMPTTAIAYR